MVLELGAELERGLDIYVWFMVRYPCSCKNGDENVFALNNIQSFFTKITSSGLVEFCLDKISFKLGFYCWFKYLFLFLGK